MSEEILQLGSTFLKMAPEDVEFFNLWKLVKDKL